MKYLITGGAGFIGSAVVRKLINEGEDDVLVFDKLTYAGNLESLATVSDDNRFSSCPATSQLYIMAQTKAEGTTELGEENC